MGKMTGGAPRLRRVLARDDYLCRLCFLPIDGERGGSGTVDHIIPVAWGGPSAMWNLRAAHASCNNRRADNTPEVWPIAFNLAAESPEYSVVEFIDAAHELINVYRETHQQRLDVLRKYNIR